MSAGEPPVAPDDLNPTSAAQAAMQMGHIGLPSAAEIWSTRAEASPPPERVAGQVTTPEVFPAPEIAAAAEPDSIWQDHAWDSSWRRRSPGQSRSWPPRRLSLALQGGGSFGAFTWGVLDRLLEEPNCSIDTISGASAGAVNAVLLASGFVEGGREGARARLRRFWRRVTDEASFRSLMLIGGFSPAGTSVAFGRGLPPAQFDPVDLDPLRQLLAAEIDFAALRDPICPQLLVAATAVRDGGLRIFHNQEITADALLASTCPPLIHCAVEIDGEAYWDGGYAANPPVVRLVQVSVATDVLVVQVVPKHDRYVPITVAAIDRRLDQIMANSALNAEIAALDLVRDAATSPKLRSLRLFRIAAEDEIDGLAQRSAVDIGRNFITMMHGYGHDAADRWLSRDPEQTESVGEAPQDRNFTFGAFEFPPTPVPAL